MSLPVRLPVGLPVGVVYASAFRGRACSLTGLGAEVDLPVAVWTAPAGPTDHLLLAHCLPPTLDIGCGPGRLTALLAARGDAVLGIDLVPEAVRQTRSRGAAALRRDVFDRLPGEGRWRTALLADGNIGIGGDPVALLRRVAELLAPHGRVVADLAPPGTGLRRGTARLNAGGLVSRRFGWALVGADAADGLAVGAGFTAHVQQWAGRWFAVLEKGP